MRPLRPAVAVLVGVLAVASFASGCTTDHENPAGPGRFLVNLLEPGPVGLCWSPGRSGSTCRAPTPRRGSPSLVTGDNASDRSLWGNNVVS